MQMTFMKYLSNEWPVFCLHQCFKIKHYVITLMCKLIVFYSFRREIQSCDELLGSCCSCPLWSRSSHCWTLLYEVTLVCI